MNPFRYRIWDSSLRLRGTREKLKLIDLLPDHAYLVNLTTWMGRLVILKPLGTWLLPILCVCVCVCVCVFNPNPM